MCVFLYADDILLLAPSLSCLQQLLYICEDELQWLDLTINARKSACIKVVKLPVTRNRKHRRAAAKPAACAPNAVNTREQGKEGGRMR